jgi:hypothetical protein
MAGNDLAYAAGLAALRLLGVRRSATQEHDTSTTPSPMVDFSTAVSSAYYGSTGRSPAGGLSAAVWHDLWWLTERLHTVLRVRNSP